MYENFILCDELSIFDPVKKIIFKISQRAAVRIILYDIVGIERAVVLDKKMNPGTYEINWHCNKIPTGVYYIRIEAGEFVDQKQLMVLN